MIYSGNIGCRLESSEVIDYGEVLEMMKTVWREVFLINAELETVEA